MAYKMKPNKSVMSRFKVTRTGKVKRHHAKTSHLMSRRTSKSKRRLGRPAILHEGLARNMRRLMGVEHKNPIRLEHERSLREHQKDAPALQEQAKTGPAPAATKPNKSTTGAR
jgi:large subunit ribosomal protein L35